MGDALVMCCLSAGAVFGMYDYAACYPFEYSVGGPLAVRLFDDTLAAVTIPCAAAQQIVPMDCQSAGGAHSAIPGRVVRRRVGQRLRLRKWRLRVRYGPAQESQPASAADQRPPIIKSNHFALLSPAAVGE